MKNILFSGNVKVFDGMLTCMLSIFMRTKSEEPYNFYIFTIQSNINNFGQKVSNAINSIQGYFFFTGSGEKI